MSDLKSTGLFFEDGKAHHVESQDVEPVLLHAQYLRETNQTGDGDMRHAAKIPLAVMEEWRKKRGISFHEMMGNQAIASAFLNSPEVAPYRIWKGRV